MPVRDRTWARFATVRAAGPVAPPDAETLRAQLRELARLDPGHPWLCRVDLTRGRLRPVTGSALDAFVDAVVREIDGDPGPERLAREQLAEPLGELPFRLVLGRSSVALRSAHLLGDGAVVDRWFPALLAGGGASALRRRDTSRSPLLRAGLRRFGRHPLDAVRAVRGAFPLAPPAPPRTREVPELGVPEVVTATVPAAEVARLRAARDEGRTRASVAAQLMSRTAAALARHGVVAEGALVMMDCRRYLGPGAAVTGNFAAGPYLDVDATNAEAMAAALARATDDAVPLVLLAAATARTGALGLRRRLGGSPGVVSPSRVGVPVQPRLTLSYQGRLALDDLPWLDRKAARYLQAAQPAGPEGITVAFAPTSAGTQLTATAHPDVFDPALLRAALAEVAGEAVAGAQPVGSVEGGDSRMAVSARRCPS
ncbi:hypothetical protein [Nocardioides ferulae]|uniref:hypothetical protein n=1 Tax=Nocardioides ferulae TaxID=2340821 RepID=UPI000F87062D|nr:hypothetical protein [Nocardioides ferulae]